MAAGVPVVASRSGAVVETVKDGETGFLVPKNDARALANRILKLVEDDSLRERMGRAGRRRALECFSWDRIAERMYERYTDLCNAGVRDEYRSVSEFTGADSNTSRLARTRRA
jgi:glycosyltransferase involved in cell wall biosynthesis